MPIRYDIQIGSLVFGNDDAARRPLLSVESEIGAGGGVGRCLLHLGDISWAHPEVGDPVRVHLDVGAGPVAIFTGEVERVCQRPAALYALAYDGLAKMAQVEVEGVYEEVSAGFIVRELIAEAGASAGEVEDGPTFPSYLVHRGPRALRHAQRLGERVGAELASDGDGKVHFRRPKAAPAVQRLVWAQDLLEIDLQERRLAPDAFSIWGEGAAGTEGAERWHWLPIDLAGVSGEASISMGAAGEPGSATSGGGGELARRVCDGAVRSVEVANEVASARAELIALRPIAGHVVALGRPALQPGDWVDLVDLPGADGGVRSLRILKVAHSLSNAMGLHTRLEF